MNNKNRGNSWERQCARELSLILTNGQFSHIFWRTASSGALATSNSSYITQRGDLCLVSPGYEDVIDFVIECKWLSINSIIPCQSVLKNIIEGLFEKYELNWLLALKIKTKGKYLISPCFSNPIMHNSKMIGTFIFEYNGLHYGIFINEMELKNSKVDYH